MAQPSNVLDLIASEEDGGLEGIPRFDFRSSTPHLILSYDKGSKVYNSEAPKDSSEALKSAEEFLTTLSREQLARQEPIVNFIECASWVWNVTVRQPVSAKVVKAPAAAAASSALSVAPPEGSGADVRGSAPENTFRFGSKCTIAFAPNQARVWQRLQQQKIK